MVASFVSGAIVAGAGLYAMRPPASPAVTQTVTKTVGTSDQEELKMRRYAAISDLAELPYFDVAENGLLHLTLKSLEGGIDGHVHFALNALMGPKPDLLKQHPETKYYLDLNDQISLDCYMAENQTEKVKTEMKNSIVNMLLPSGSPMTVTHTIPNLLAEMDLLGIEKAVVFPIAYGFPFGDDMTDWYLHAIQESGKQDRFIVCGSVKPTSKHAVQKVDEYASKGLKGIKMHPVFARFYPNDKAAWPCYEAIQGHNLPVLIHCGRAGDQKVAKGIASEFYNEDHSDVKYYEEPISAFQDLRFVLCHSGALQNEEAIEIAKKYSNVWLDIQGQSVQNIRRMISEVGPERLMWGSDYPFYPEAVILARLLVATEDDRTLCRSILSENAKRFWGITS